MSNNTFKLLNKKIKHNKMSIEIKGKGLMKYNSNIVNT